MTVIYMELLLGGADNFGALQKFGSSRTKLNYGLLSLKSSGYIIITDTGSLQRALQPVFAQNRWNGFPEEKVFKAKC